MAISTSLQLNDGISPALRMIEQNLKGTLIQFQNFQHATEKAIQTSAYESLNTNLLGIDHGISKNTTSMGRFGQEITNSTRLMRGLRYAIAPIGLAIGTILSGLSSIKAVDAFTQTRARLTLVNDGLQTTAELNGKIFASAQRVRSSYSDIANVVAKLGITAKDAFSSNNEMIFFAEQMNKQFKISGAGLQEQTAAMYQLTQAMASGRLQGDEFRSIIENAPMLAMAIEKEMGVTRAELKALSSEGAITADVIKRSLVSSAKETNEMFAKMPITFGELGTVISNVADNAFQGLFSKIASVTLSPNMTIAVNILSNALVALASLAEMSFSALMVGFDAVSWVAQSMFSVLQIGFGVLESMLPIIVTGLGVYLGYLVAINSATVISNGLSALRNGLLAVKNGLLAAAAVRTTILTAAQSALNTAMMMNPIGLIIVLLGLLIGGIAATSIATHGLRETFASVWSGIVNTVGWAINLIIDMLNGLVSVMNTVGGALGKMLGFTYTNISELSHVDVSGIDASGQDFIKNFDIHNMLQAPDLGGVSAGGAISGMQNDMAKTAGNTGRMANDLEDIEEDLNDMRLSAEREAINKFTNEDIKIEIVNNNSVNNDVDLDGMGDRIGRSVLETIYNSREGM